MSLCCEVILGLFYDICCFSSAILLQSSLSLGLLNIVQIGPSAAQWWHQLYSTSGFRNFAHPRRSESTGTPNFGEISQSTAAIWLLPVSENNRPWCWNSTCTFGFDFHICVTIGMSFCICLPNFVQIGPSATYKYDVVSIFRDGGRQPYWIISRLLQTTHQVQMRVSGSSSNFDSIGFMVPEILLFLCYDILA